MRALILAAGTGERLRPYTDRVPKPMLEIGGRPVLQRNVELLREAGATEILINLHHRPDAIRNHFGDGSAFGVSIAYAYEPELLGTAGALRRASAFLDGGDFFVVYGDNLATIDLRALMAAHRDKSAIATIAVFHRDDPRSSGIVGLDESDRVVRFLEKPGDAEIFSRWVNAGYLALSPSAIGHVPDALPSDLGRDVLPELVARGLPVYGYRMPGELWWIDTADDYRRVKERFERSAT